MTNESNIIEVRQRTKKGANTVSITLTIPEFLMAVIEEEAKEKGKSLSNVASYLIYSGLKAHIGEFGYPADNTIQRNYMKRGRIWNIAKK